LPARYSLSAALWLCAIALWVGVEAPERREFRKEEAAIEMRVLKEKGGQRIKRRRRRKGEAA
jgi:hypothetical protein